MGLFNQFIFTFSFIVGFTISLFSQNNNEFYVKNIDTADLRTHLTHLTSTDFDGRMTGTFGQKKAANYLQNEFLKMNCKAIDTHYYQSFKLYKDGRSGSIFFNNQTLNFPKDFGFFNLRESFSFLISDFLFIENIDKQKNYSDFYLVFHVKNLASIDVDAYQNMACKGFVFIVSDYDERYFSFTTDRFELASDSLSLPILFVNQQSISSKYLQKLKKNKKQNLTIHGILNPNPTFVTTENVIGFIEGSDSTLKDEVVVISAHYDHLGSKDGELFYGADDNGSGTAALIELASAFQHAKRDGNQPKRSILLIAFTAEELGLLGSEFYVRNPLIPLEKTVANFNIDMIGRKTAPFETDSLLMVYLIGANRLSLQMDSIIKKSNRTYTNLIIDETYNAFNEPQNLYYRSDHYHFAKNNIPSCFFFGGFHSDYHEPTDTIEKISFKKIAQISQLIFHSVWMVADAPNRLRLID